MPGFLFDTNVWIASVFPAHPHYTRAQRALHGASHVLPAVFCRATQQGFLRLATTQALIQTFDVDGFSNRDAVAALKALLNLPQVVERPEAPGLSAIWHKLASRDTAAPNVWMDAYLAAFAITGGLQMVTLDHDFRQFEAHGLKLTLLDVPG